MAIVFENTTTTAISQIPKSRLQKVEEGLRFIIGHFNPNEPLWPRTISTYTTGGKQIVIDGVNSEEEFIQECMKWLKTADFWNCRISAYPIYTDEYIQRTGIIFVPNILLCDLDREHFGTDEEFETAVSKTMSNFEKTLGVRPTLLWTGPGVHFILPQSIIKPLEKIDEFKQFPRVVNVRW